MSKKVLLFIETGGGGGAETVVLNLAQLLKAEGIDVIVASLRVGWLSNTLKEKGIPYYNVPSNTSLDFTLPFRIASLARKENCDLIHSHLLDANFYCSIASLISGIPLICTEHGDVHHTKKRKLQGLKLKLISLFAKRITAVSNYSAKRLIELGVSAKKVVTIGNPIAAPMNIDPTVRNTIRSELKIPTDNHWLWIQVANLRKVKDQSTLIKAFAAVNSAKHSLIIIGEGEERPELEELIVKLNVQGQVKLLGFKDNVSEFLQAADGFILSSKSEALPMSILEAAMYKKLVISSDVGGIGDLIIDNQSGFLFPAGDIQKLSRIMNDILEHKRETDKISTNLFDSVQDRFSNAVVIKKIIELYDF